MIEGIDLSILVYRCLIPIVALLIGWVIGFFDSNNRTAKKIREAEGKTEVAIKEAQKKVAEAEERLSLFATTGADDPGLLRLKDESGQLALELDGEHIDTAAGLSAEQKKRLIGLLSLVRPWLEGGQPASAPTPPSRTVQTPPAPAPVIMSSLTPEVKPTAKKAAPPPLSIVEQIDSILQKRMMNTPLAGQDIRLQESHEGGVEVMIGMKKYSTVEEVPDAAVKSAIRAAIDEWEKTYTPGL